MKRVQLVLLLLLVIPGIVNFVTPIYNFDNPTLGGLPFFYWFQILLLALCAIPYLVFSLIEDRRSKMGPSGRAGGN